jgi:hypothetical protein
MGPQDFISTGLASQTIGGGVLLRLARVRPLACGLARPGQPRMWRLWNTGTKDLGQGPPGPPKQPVPTTAAAWRRCLAAIVVDSFLSHLALSYVAPRNFPVYGHGLTESLHAKERDIELLQDLASGGGRSWEHAMVSGCRRGLALGARRSWNCRWPMILASIAS